MADELKFPDPSERRTPRDSGALDERTARLIRDAYRPPMASGEAENAYWTALERGIMDRVRRTGPAQREQTAGWLSVLNGWAQVGLVAAAALFAAAGLVSNQLGEPEEQVAYESVLPTAPEALSTPVQIVTASGQSAQRDAAFQYLLSY